ncbi:MAG: carbohydrate-binding protein, partial [Oscillospiraceae bacterium]|nr:carbohydrate-binding protein [Oscillospiraceae bacterium]
QEGIKTQECADTDGGEQVAYVENGDYLLFKNVDFGDGAKSFTARLAGNDAHIEIYLDSLNGTPAGTLNYTGVGNWSDWSDASCNVSVTGKHDVYLKFTGGEGYLVNLNWLTFGKEALPINGTYFKNLIIQDTANEAGWSFAENLAVGSKVFGDRDFTFTELPEQVLGAEQILTSCDSKKFLEGTAGTFEASETITVYTAVDTRTENTPAFLADWTKTELTAVSSNDVTFEIYQKNFSKGDTVTLGANGQSAYCVNYTVFLTEQAKEVPTTEPFTEKTTEKVTESVTELITESDSFKEPLYGDVNCDGEIDILDVITLNKSVMGKEILSEQGILNADVNLDQKPDATDALNILKLIVGLISPESFPLK